MTATKRQDNGFIWALIGYHEPNCKGDVVANWRGSTYAPHCIRIDTTKSVAGGSGNGAGVNIWVDNNCTVPVSRLELRGKDENGFPCYNAIVQSFSLTK